MKFASVSILGPILFAALAASAQAQPAAQTGQGALPTKAVRIVVPFPAGGVLDRLTRTLGQKLNEAWGQPVIVDNKPGAGTVIGTNAVAHAAPDGHTLLMMAVSFVINPSLRSNLPYAIDRDFTPVMQIASTPNVLVVNNTVPATDLQQLIALAKAKPGQLAFAFHRRGHAAAPRRRAAQADRQGRSHSRAVPGRRAGRDGASSAARSP